MTSLFDSNSLRRSCEQLGEGAVLLRVFRHVVTPGGHAISVAMTKCGRLSWVSDRTGYRYDPVDPDVVGSGLLMRVATRLPGQAWNAALPIGQWGRVSCGRHLQEVRCRLWRPARAHLCAPAARKYMRNW